MPTMRSWREVPEFAGADITDWRADGTPVPFKKSNAKQIQRHLQRLGSFGEQALQVVIGRGHWTEFTTIIVRTPNFLVIDGYTYWQLAVPTRVPQVGATESKRARLRHLGRGHDKGASWNQDCGDWLPC
ncbi:hypothetical protein P9990_25275 (plasmid) [Prescottella equi]|uniref:hypothetical protein n=1 Tax=Rhodococcus hoagii TaxID=43767 RepID=UPI0025769437|nr:hypothetical protein [Prescottella equi]WJJ14508.1 hypothetical protein P9990_25275 [Prescottella equi]